jgi:hypothetical protein
MQGRVVSVEAAQSSVMVPGFTFSKPQRVHSLMGRSPTVAIGGVILLGNLSIFMRIERT